MSTTLMMLWIYVLVLGCSAAALSSLKSEICHEMHRADSDKPLECGTCIQNYIEDSDTGDCVECFVDCKARRREPCKADNPNVCGGCLNKYIDIEGVCTEDTVVEELIKRIEEFELESKSNGKIQSSNSYIDKKAEVSINEDVPQSVLLNNGFATTTHDSKPTSQLLLAAAAKRVPVQESNSEEHFADHTTKKGFSQLVFFVVVLSVSLICVAVLIVAGVIWYRVYRRHKSSERSDYNGYPGEYNGHKMSKSDSGDRKLAHSAQMYHYQHHKQQMIALEKSLSDKLEDSDNDDDDDERNENGDYTVYECPGLAPAGEMEVQNPLFVASKVSTGSSSTSPETLSPATPALSPGNVSSTSESGTEVHE